MINYTERISELMDDIVARVPTLSFIDTSRVLVFARAGRTAERGRDGRGIEIVGAHHAERGNLLDMRVAVDAARKDELPARIDLASTPTERSSDRRDALTTDADVAFEHVLVGCDRAVANHDVEITHELRFTRVDY